jgi:hypothetical protein
MVNVVGIDGKMNDEMNSFRVFFSLFWKLKVSWF